MTDTPTPTITGDIVARIAELSKLNAKYLNPNKADKDELYLPVDMLAFLQTAPEMMEIITILQSEHAALLAERDALREALSWHVDDLDLGNIGFYDKHGFNAAEIIPKSRALLTSPERTEG